MKYLNLIEKIWQYNHKKRFGVSVVALYFYLLRKWNDSGEINFKLPDSELVTQLGISRNTVKSGREKLRNMGVIQYESKNGLPTYYRIVVDYSIIDTKVKNPKEKGEPKVSVPSNTSEKADSLFSNNTSDNENSNWSKYMKELKSESVLSPTPEVLKIEEPTPEHTPELPPLELPKPPKNGKAVILPEGIPTLEEFLNHAKTFENYTADYDFSLSAKYERWIADGWKNGYGKPIRNWKVALKSTFPHLKTVKSELTPSLQKIRRTKPTYNE